MLDDIPGVGAKRRRELLRQGPSYTIDSLEELRAELGEQTGLCLIVGVDAVAGIDQWHRWRELTRLAHIVVMQRPGSRLPQSGLLAEWLENHHCENVGDLRASPAGRVMQLSLRPLAISSTEIRELIADGRSPRYLLPDAVWQRIQSAGLYGSRSTSRE